MAESIIPAGAFAAMKAGTPMPPASPIGQPKAETKPDQPPKTITRKAAAQEASAEIPPPNLTPAEKKIWKLKVDGEEFDFDASDDEAVKREIMKSRGADKRFESAAQIKKQADQIKQQAETFLSMLKDPASLRKVLEDPRIGVDVKKFAQDYVWEQIQEEKMSPEEKAQRERDRKYEELLREKEERTTSEKQQEKLQKQVVYENSYEEKITRALEIGGLPKTHGTVERMADYLKKAIKHNIDLSPEELVNQVRRDYSTDIDAILEHIPEERIIELLGEKAAAKIRKADLGRLKTTQSNPFPKRSVQKTQKTQAPVKKRTMDSGWREEITKGFFNRNK